MKNLPQYIAEFIGTFFLVFLGCGSVILSEVLTEYNGALIPFIFGGTVAIMIFATGHISGAHFNPAVTISFWLIKRFPANRILGYLIAQFAGALLASGLHLWIWGDAHSFGATTLNISLSIAILFEFLLSFVLMFVITSVATDSRAVGELAGLAIGMTVSLCALVGGPLTGASMNPARSLAPAIFSGEFYWIYLLVPVLGAAFGAKTYEWIRCHRDEVDENEKHGCC